MTLRMSLFGISLILSLALTLSNASAQPDGALDKSCNWEDRARSDQEYIRNQVDENNRILEKIEKEQKDRDEAED